MAKETPHDASGTTFTFPGFTGDITAITFNKGTREMIDVSHFGLTTNDFINRQVAPLRNPSTLSVDFIGTGSLAGGTTGSLSISGVISVSGNATVMSSSVTLSVNDVIRGSAEFEVEN